MYLLQMKHDNDTLNLFIKHFHLGVLQNSNVHVSHSGHFLISQSELSQTVPNSVSTRCIQKLGNLESRAVTDFLFLRQNFQTQK